MYATAAATYAKNIAAKAEVIVAEENDRANAQVGARYFVFC